MRIIWGGVRMPSNSEVESPNPDIDFREGAAEGLVRAGDQTSAPQFQFFDNLRMGLLKSLNVGQAQPGATAIFVFAERPREVAVQLGANNRIFDLDMRPPSVW